MKRLLRLLALLSPFSWQVVAAVVLGAVTIGSGVGLMGTAAFLIATAALQPSIADLQVAIVGVRFFGLSRGVFRYLERLVSHDLTLRLLGRLRVWFFRAVEPLAPARTLELKSADLLTRVVADVESLQELYLRSVVPFLVALVVGVGASWVISVHASLSAAVFLAGFVATAVLVSAVVLWLGHRVGNRLAAARSALAETLTDGVQGMADLLAFGGESEARKRLAEHSATTESLRLQAACREAVGNSGITFGTHATVWAVLVFSIPLIGETGFSGIDLAVICLVAMAAFEAVQPLPAAARGLADQLEAAGRIFAVLDARPAVEDPATSRAVDSADEIGLELRGVDFTYSGGGPVVLENVNLDLPAGSRTAIVGPSGAGKSSLVHLLLRFWDPSAGEIRLGGRPLPTIALEHLRSTIGVLPQRVDLFTGTIRDNLVLAEPDASAADLDAAVDRAGLLDTIHALPDGLNTWVGEHGMQLSGGQRQRLALAGLILRDPSVVVLDEPTAGLDPVTEGRVMDSVLELFADRTTVVITHRLVAMERFDTIVVLDEGRIVERGIHADLVGAKGLYRQLHDAQRLELASF